MTPRTKALLAILLALAAWVTRDPSAPRVTTPETGDESDARLFADEAQLRNAIETWNLIREDPWHLRRTPEFDESEQEGFDRLRAEYAARYGDPDAI